MFPFHNGKKEKTMYGEWQNCITESLVHISVQKIILWSIKIITQTFNLIIGHLHNGAILVHTF